MSTSIKISSSRNIRSFRRIDLVFAILAIVVLLATALLVVRGSAAADDPDCAPLPSGLIGWWPGNGNADDIQGPTFENGVLENGALTVSGKVGQAFSFDGNLSSMTLPDSALKDAYGALTIDAWVYPLNQGSDWVFGTYGRTIISNTDGDGFALRVKDGFIQADLRLSSGNLLHSFTQAQVPLNAWSHVALTYDGSTVRAYLNGTELGTGVPATGNIKNTTNATTCTMIGNEPNACGAATSSPGVPAGFGWQGLIDEIDFSDRALSAAEILAIYNADSGGKCHTNSYAFSSDTYTVNEGDAITVTVTRSGIMDINGSVDYTTSDIGATAGLDYTAQSGTLNFAPGETSQTFQVQTLQDNIFEGVEDIGLTLSNPTGGDASLGAQSTSTIVIQDDDTEPTLSVNDITQDEGNSGQSDFVFTVSLSNPTTQTVTVDYATADGIVDPATGGASCGVGTDYVTTSGTLTFNPGEVSKAINVPVCGDIVFELHETFTVTLANSANASISSGTGTGTITNDDVEPTLAIDDVTQDEGDSGEANFVFAVSLSNPSSQTVNVNFSTNDGSALGGALCAIGTDYLSSSGTVTFNPGETSKPINVSVCGDTVFEVDEAFTVILDTPSNATIASGTGTGTISNDDAAPSFAIDNVTEDEGDSGTTNFVFTVTKTGSTALSSTVDFATQDGTATVADNDYAAQNGTLTFGPTDTAMQITVVVNGDTTFEPTEAFTVQLSNPDNATISTAEGTGTITNDDVAPSFAIDNVTESEGDSGTTNFVFTVTKTGGTALSSTVDFTTQDGAATVADNDYAAQNGTLTFGPTDTAMQITVVVNGDTTVEADETFTVALSNATEATIGTASGSGNILNDDTEVSVAVSPASVVEDDATNLVYTFTRIGVVSNALTVNFQVGGSATFNSDYTQTGADTFDGSSGTVTFPAGDAAVTITIDPTADGIVEADEDVVITILVGAGYNVGTPNPATGTITDDETCPASFTVNDTGDTGDANLGDGICDDGTGKCTLRAAIEEANSLVTCGSININFAVAGVITLNGTELALDHDLFINGNTTNAVVINGNDASRIFSVQSGNSVAISNLTLTAGNGSGSNGGAIVNDGALTITGLTLTGNSAGSNGGAIYNTGTLTITNSTISGNTANGNGGGIDNLGTATITNVTVTNNRADVDSDTNGSGGGLSALSGSVTLRNSIIAGNFNGPDPATTADDVNGLLDNATSFNNLIGDGTGMTGVSQGSNGNQVGAAGTPINALLGFLADNGGVTFTHALLPASPALDAGDNSFVLNPPFDGPPFTDQRGFARIADGPDADTTATVDVGAFEAHPSISDIGDQVTDEDVSINALQFNVGDIALGIASITADSDNPALVQSITVNNETTANPDLTILLNADQFGQATITVTVTAINGQSMSDTFQLTVNSVNDDPTTIGIPNVNVDEDSAPTIINLTSFFNDVEDGAGGLVYTLQGNTSPGLFTSVNITGGQLTLEYAPNAFGAADITIRATDSGGKSVDTTFTVTVNAVNDPPTADNQAVVTDEDTPVVITLTGSDPENDPLSFTVVDQPTNGVFSGTAPNVTYTPNLNYHGPDSFTFKVNDGAADSAFATVSITVNSVNDVPVANAQSVNTDEDTALSITLTGTDAETPANSLIFTVTNGPAHGTLSGTAPNLTYTPQANYNGPDSFTFNVNDGEADSADASVSITVNPVNDPPTADPQSVTTDEDVAVAITLTGSDVETAANSLSFTVTDGPSNGALSGTAPNLTYTPNADYNGSDSFKFTVTDTGDGTDGALTSAEATVSITINPVNDAPIAVDDSYATPENTPLNMAAPGVLNNDTDVENDTLTAVLVNGPSNAASFALNPDGSFSYTPANGFGGTDTFTYKANDGSADSNNATVTITVNEGGSLRFSAAAYSVNENAGNAVITITRADGSAGTATVLFETSNGTATAADYTSVSQVVTFNDGENSKTVNVPIIDDQLSEGDETINLRLSNVGGSGSLGLPSTAVLTITDDDAQPSLSIDDVWVNEGHSGTTDAVFSVSLSAPSSLTVTVNVATADGTATAGSDYEAIVNSTLTFNPGDLSKTVIVKVIGDEVAEADETFFVNLSGASNATISDSQGVGTIIDDDPAGGSVKLSSATYSTPEGSGSVIITVERTGDTSQAATVDYKTSDITPSHIPCSTLTGSASSRCDYVFTLGTVRFEVGDTTKTIAIPSIDDSRAEGPETFTITLSNATGATLGTPASSTITINDNETQDGPNPIFDTPLFVRMHYLDFLAREPESSEPWSGVLNNCSDVNNDPACDRLTVSAAFFGSPEFQLKGYFVYRFYKLAFDRLPEYDEIIPDITAVTGQTPAEVYAKKAAFSNGFAQRQEFTDAFSSMTNAQYVTALMGRYGLSQVTTPDPVAPDGDQKVVLTTAQLTSQLTAGTLSRAQILRAIADSDEVFQIEFNRAFVAMQYYGYLRRTPESAGYNAWLNYLNDNPSDFRTMVNGFVNSIEYKLRFGPP